MLEVMYDEPGIGLAAPQIGEAMRLIVIDTDWKDEEAGGERSPLVLLNPEIVEREGTLIWNEGCLSVPDFTADVERAARVRVRGARPRREARWSRTRERAARRLLPARDRPPRRRPLHRPHQPAEAQPVRAASARRRSAASEEAQGAG